jgi:outer membrane protein TolC
LGTIHDLRDASGRWLEKGQRATALEVAGLAGQRWLDLAAATARTQLAEIRVERLDKALLIQRKRFELGEISGSERRQVELQQARESAILRQSEAQMLALRHELEVLAPSGFENPVAEDLAGLVESTATPEVVSTAELVEQAPLLRFVESGAEVARLQAKRQRGSAWGQPEVEVEWERIPDLDVIEGFDSFGFRLSVPLPVGKKGHQQLRASEQSANVAAAEQELVRQRTVARFQAVTETARGAEAALEALGPSMAEVEATGRSLSEQFRLGAISYLVYLDGFSRLDEVIRQVIEARHLLLVARLELAEIAGTDVYFPLPEMGSEGES